MEMLNNLWVIRLCVVSAFAVNLFAGTAIGSEFRPIQVPNQQYQMIQKSPERIQQPQQMAVDESVYERFKQDVSKMSPDKRKRLTRRFEDRRDKAIKNEKLDESRHYVRLLQILNDTK